MKNSGISWIGEIPSTWLSGTIKRFCTFKTGTTPSTNNPEWFDGDLKWYTPGDFNDKYILNESNRTLSQKAQEMGVATIIPKNSTLLVGIGATAGKIGFNQEVCSCNQQITALIPSVKITPKYLMYWMISNTKFLRETAMFTTLPILNNRTIGEYTLICPSDTAEQKTIVDFLDEKCAKIDASIELKYRQLEELNHYKKSIIYEYVTGKKRVA